MKKTQESLRQSESDSLRNKCDFEYYQKKFDDLTKQKADLDDLIIQAKLNQQDMREQKEKLNEDVSGLKENVESLNQTLKKTQDELKMKE